MPEFYYEDFVPGAVAEFHADRPITKEEIVRFAAAYDPQPFHLDEAAGKASILGGDDVALNVELLGEAVEDEFVETRGSVMDVDPVQWSRINGMDNGRVVRIRPVPRKEKENMQ